MGFQRYLLLVFALLVGCGRDKLIHANDTRCNTPCYEGPEGVGGKGICLMGKWVCDQNGDLKDCEGWVAPSEEDCNGLDNDCDGMIDAPVRTCTTACGFGPQRCVNGVWDTCRAPQPQPEVCNGKDDNCDGLVDEPQNIAVTPCYDLGLDSPTLKNGECRFGITRCQAGTTVCVGQVLPTFEICNGKDDDCNGVTDDGLNPTNRIYYFIFVFDQSGSMDPHLARVKQATASWGNKYGSRTDMKFAVVWAPGQDPSTDGKVTLAMNFSNAQSFVTEVNKLAAGMTGSEETIDAVYDISDPSNPLGLTWGRGLAEKAIFMFGDEFPQTALNIDTADAGAEAADAGIIVIDFTEPYNFAAYLPMTAPTGGQVYDIWSSAIDIEDKLDQTITTMVCK